MSPAGRPLVLSLEDELPPVVTTRKVKNCPTRAVVAVLLRIVGPDGGGGWMERARVAFVVPTWFEALKGTWNVPVVVGLPTIAEIFGSKVSPEGRLVAANEDAPVAESW
jgi:hypothetical protein